MQTHFSSFTPEAMRALGQELASGSKRRRECIDSVKQQTSAFLASFRRAHREAEMQRRQQAERDANARRVFMSELLSGGHALRSRFQLARREMAAELRQMASELHSACEAWSSRPGRQSGTSFRASGRPTTRPSREEEQGSQANAAGRDEAKRPAHSKRRNG